MKNAPMRFDGMSLRHNPERLTVSEKNNIREYNSPCCEADSVNLGQKLRRVEGEGELCGADCIAQYQALENLRHLKKKSKLVLPRMQPMYAYLKELSMTAKPINDVLSYRFVFIEAQSPRQESKSSDYYLTVSEGESLWDIAYAYAVPIEQLVELNPQIAFIDNLRQGERVKIC